ncbi:MAG: tRNA nucleotidyltransferase, partial [Bacteroides sp.]|nr:tRNA nucleotidyltransferase [Bacteroides sp.]
MKELTSEELRKHFEKPIFKKISEVADRLEVECYAVGGYVRDIFLQRDSKDIDVVVVGSGISVAEELKKELGKGANLAVFKNFGTAQIKHKGIEVEFVGARKESYNRDSRKPIVEDGSLEDDQNRRDFTINAMAVRLNSQNFGELVDPFNGMQDLRDKIIRTPLDPDITFSDDPLRMMRCIRFATQLGFHIDDDTFEALCRNKERIEIISKERIADELNKIILSPMPSKGFIDLDRCGLLPLIFPELCAMQGVEVRNGKGHKDNFYHTLEVLDNIAKMTDNLWLRWSAIL